MSHTCDTIGDVLEDVVGLGWIHLPDVLSADAALIWATPDSQLAIALDAGNIPAVWATAALAGRWSSTVTAFHSYGTCGTCVYVQETFSGTAELQPA